MQSIKPTTTIAATTAVTSTTKSCVECMRRKIRCDGNLPCNRCIYYEVPTCQYRHRKKRKSTAPRLTTVAAVSTHQSAAEALVARLFPGLDPASIIDLSTQDLLNLAQKVSEDARVVSTNESQALVSPATTHGGESDEERGWHEFRLHHEVCDDVNGLSLNVHRRSYLGSSSIHAILRAMFHVKPFLQRELQRSIPIDDASDSSDLANPSLSSRSYHQNLTPAVQEETAINAYFADIHGIVPLLDEAYFRVTWHRGQRCDRPWLALLNMVLVLGSLAVGDDESSHIYYARAQSYLDFDLLGTGCLESLQALCLLGGLYLHYKNSPNTAYAIMGLAYRMAVGLGLHRQPTGLADGDGSRQEALEGPWRPQIRRQIWWSLFCLDTWGSMTLGRPTLGRWDADTMDVQPAIIVPNNISVDPPALSLDSAREFCVIATKIQHRLAHVSPLGINEVVALDSEVQGWYYGLPLPFLDLSQCPASLLSAQYIMRNRYINLRLLLFRAILLRYAHGNVQFEMLPAREKEIVQTCRKVACEAVDQATFSMQTSSKILICSAVWYLYQAAMVLLLGIMIDPDHAESSEWRGAVNRALALFSNAIPWSRAAVRSKRVVETLVHATTETAASPSEAHDIGNLEGVPGESLWDLFGLDIFTEEGWTWDASEWIDWSGMGYNN